MSSGAELKITPRVPGLLPLLMVLLSFIGAPAWAATGTASDTFPNISYSGSDGTLASGGGQLTPAITTPTGTANLTGEGVADWVHWGKDSASSVNRKAGVAAQIGALTTIGGSAARFASAARLAYSWSDGTPTGSTTTQAGLYIAGLNRGYQLQVPADTSARTLVVYLGGWQARGRIEVSLSDGSAPAFVQTVENLSTAFDRRLALSYRAGSAGQTLTVRYLQETSSGNITMQAATLQGTGAPVNQPPVLAAIADQSGTVGSTLTVGVSASDSDGPAPLVLTTSALPGSASFSDAGDGSGTLSWTPLAGDVAGSPYSVTVTATDGAGAAASRSFNVTVAAAPGGGQLTPAITTPTGTANLTGEGVADWVHWGKDSASSVNRKAGVAAQIGALTTIGGSAARFASAARLAYSWSDGTPTGSATTQAGLYIAGLNRGYQLQVPADTSERTLVVYLGGWQARGRIEVSLSDGSAPAFVQTVENLSTAFDRRLALSYRAGSAGQTLTVRYLQETSSGNITMQAATLQGTGAPVNQAPVLAAIADQNATVGAPLTVAVSASDPDGPLPLTLTATGVPAGASFSDNGSGSGTLQWTPAAGDVSATPYTITVSARDGAGAGASQSFNVTVAAAPGGGQLTPAITTPTGTANLTGEGVADWVHWGKDSASSVNRKAGVAAQIGALTTIGGSAARFGDAGTSRATAGAMGHPRGVPPPRRGSTSRG